MWNKFSASEGYLLAKQMGELLLKREDLKIKKIGFQQLNCEIGKSRIGVMNIKDKIIKNVKKANREYLRKYAEEKCKNKNKNKVVNIESYMEVAR